MDRMNESSKSPYSPPKPEGPIDLWLDANEGSAACVDVGAIAASLGQEGWRRYPSAGVLARALAGRMGVSASRVIVTAGGDECIDRACRAFLAPGRELILPAPTFEMIERYAVLAGARVVKVAWERHEYPIEGVMERISDRTGMIAVVSPNNPTGGVLGAEGLRRLSKAAPDAIILADLAYAEFADEDLTGASVALPNVVVIRTFSKAYGLAGMRVGYAVGPERLIGRLRGAGSPFPMSAVSLAAGLEAVRVADGWLPGVVGRVRQERARLYSCLSDLGASPMRSQGNFVLGWFDDAEGVWRSLAKEGIAVRRFAGGDGLERALRITCPCDEARFERLIGALTRVLGAGDPSTRQRAEDRT